MERRVVITGLGVVSPVGTGVEKFWNSLLEGKSGIAPITRFDAADFPVKIAGEVKDFDPALAGDKKTIRHMDRNAQFAVAAARMAVEDAKLDMEKENPGMAGTVIGTGIGGIATMEETVFRIEQKGPGKVNPFAVPMMIANMASGQVSITFGLQGPVLTDVTACASGTNAIGLAARLIKHGDADVMIAGGTEAAVAKTPMAGFAAMKALSSRECPPEEASCAGTDSFLVKAPEFSYWKNWNMRKREALIFMLNLQGMVPTVMLTILLLPGRAARWRSAACRKHWQMPVLIRKTWTISMPMAHLPI